MRTVRWTVNSLAVFSALLALLVVVLWVRATTGVDRVILRRPYCEMSIISGAGDVRLVRLDLDFTPPQYMLDEGLSVPLPPPQWRIERTRQATDQLSEFIIRQDTAPWPATWSPLRLDRGAPSVWFRESPPFAEGWMLTLPHWLLFLLLALAPIWRLRPWRPYQRRRRLRLGLCPNCTYDLRAHHPGERCPECGTRIGVELEKGR